MQGKQHLIRDRAYGVWHRPQSINRFFGRRQAQSLTMADLDSVLFVQYGYSKKLPLALVEVAQDIGQEKPTGVIRELAKMSNLPAFVALYTPTRKPNPASPAWHDIDGFRVKRVWPKPEANVAHAFTRCVSQRLGTDPRLAVPEVLVTGGGE